MFVPAGSSHIKHDLSVVKQQQFFVCSRHGIVKRCSPIPFISGLHPQTHRHGLEAWHATQDDVITGPFSRKLESVIVCCKIKKNERDQVFHELNRCNMHGVTAKTQKCLNDYEVGKKSLCVPRLSKADNL